MEPNLKLGDFTGLASNYSKNRPGYSDIVLRTILSNLDTHIDHASAADIGAGTGIWTRMLWSAGLRTITAVEPNRDMLLRGQKDSVNTSIIWSQGTGEKTGLQSESYNLVSMASSFHWVDFDKSTKEFHRILRPSGIFCSLWNPRVVSKNPLLQQIEDYITYLKPDLIRNSSGNSGITSGLLERLVQTDLFANVFYIEAPHVVNMATDRYVGAWRSVNDIRYQMGEELFNVFIEYIETSLKGVDSIEAHYMTRCWCAVK